MKRIYFLIFLVSSFNIYSQNNKEILKEIKSNAILQDFNQNAANFYKIKEIVKVDGFEEEVNLLNKYTLSDFKPINFYFIGKVNDVFSEALVFFPKGFKSKHEIIYFNNLSKKVKNLYSFKKEDTEYFILEFDELVIYDSKYYSRDYKDKYLVMEKKEIIDLLNKLRNLDNQIITFKKNLEASNFKMLIVQQKEIVNLNDYGNYINKKRQFSVAFLGENNFTLNKPFDFSKSINIDGYNFNVDFKDVKDLNGKSLKITKIKGYKNEDGSIDAKISIQIPEVKIYYLNYKNLKENYFSNWTGSFPNVDGESFYYFLESKSTNELNSMSSSDYWEKLFVDYEKFKTILDIKEVAFDEISISSSSDLNKLFLNPVLKFEKREIYEPLRFIDKNSNSELQINEFETNNSGSFFPNEVRLSLISRLKREAKELLNDKSKESKRIQGNQKVIADLTKKYGKKYVDDALAGNITVGMPEEILPIPLQAWVIKSRDDYPNGFKLYCNHSLNVDRKLLITVVKNKVVKISSW